MISGDAALDARQQAVDVRVAAEKRQMRRLRIAAYGVVALALGAIVPAALGRSKVAAIAWGVATVAGLVWLTFSHRLLRAMGDTLNELRSIAEEHTKRWRAEETKQ